MKLWPNGKAARVGYMLGQGCSTPAIAAALGDGTSADTIRRMRREWGIAGDRTKGRVISLAIELDSPRRAELNDQSQALGIAPSEFVRRVLLCVLDDDLYQAVTDGRFK